MTLAVSLMLLALGAVLTWGVEYAVVGVGSMIIGAIGLLLAMATAVRERQTPTGAVRRD